MKEENEDGWDYQFVTDEDGEQFCIFCHDDKVEKDQKQKTDKWWIENIEKILEIIDGYNDVWKTYLKEPDATGKATVNAILNEVRRYVEELKNKAKEMR